MSTYQLKNVKISEFASDDSTCFEASVFCDGKRLGRAFNAGQGGSNEYDFDVRPLNADPAIVAWACADMKAAEIRNGWGDGSGWDDRDEMQEAFDLVVGKLLEESDIIKQAKAYRARVAKKHRRAPESLTLYLADGGEAFTLAVKGSDQDHKLMTDPEVTLMSLEARVTV